MGKKEKESLSKPEKDNKKYQKNKQPYVTAAVIYIGTNSLNLKICYKKGNSIKVLEELSSAVSLGKDTFTNGKISLEKAQKTCETVNNFMNIVSEYLVDEIRVVATTAVREAENMDYFLEQVKTKTGLVITVLDDWEEKNYIYKEMVRLIGNQKKLDGSGLMVFVGSGTLGIAALDKGSVPYAQNIHIGSLRLTEILEGISEYTNEYYTVVEEYLYGFTDILNDILPQKEFSQFFASGTIISEMARICEAKKENDFLYIKKEIFISTYDIIKTKSIDQLAQDYEISTDTAEVLIPTFCVYNVLFDLTKAENITIPIVYLPDELLFEMLNSEEAARNNAEFGANTRLCASTLSQRYKIDIAHAERVELFALKIFDKLKKVHGCSNRERLLLQIAAIMHDIGKFVNLKHHYKHSYSIIKGSDIIGLSMHETNLVANIAYYHSTIFPNEYHVNYRELSRKDKVLVSKLVSILRIADALNRGHDDKFEDIDVKIEKNMLVISVSTYKNTKIEEWAFDKKALFFKEVFGMDACLKKKNMH